MNFWSLLAVLFIGLKLAGLITWSWWLVLLPLYWVVALLLISMGGALALYGMLAAFIALTERKSNRRK